MAKNYPEQTRRNRPNNPSSPDQSPSYLLISPRRETASHINTLLTENGLSGKLFHAVDVEAAKTNFADRDFDAFLLDVAGPGAFNGDATVLQHIGGKHSPVVMVNDDPGQKGPAAALPKNVGKYIDLHSSRDREELVRDLQRKTEENTSNTCPAGVIECLRLFFANADDAVVFLDENDRVLETNKAFVEMFGYLQDEIKGKHLYDLVVPEHGVGEYERKAESDTAVTKGETLRKSKDGRTLRVNVSRQPLPGNNGLAGAVLIYKDMGPHFKALEARLRGVSNYRDFFMLAPEGLYTCNTFGRFIAVNPVMAEILGYECINDLTLNVRSMSHDIYVDPDDRERLMNMVKEQGAVVNTTSRVFRKDRKEINVMESVTAVYDDDGELLYFLGVMSPEKTC